MTLAKRKTVCPIHFLNLMSLRNMFGFFIYLRLRMQIIRTTITVILPLINAVNASGFSSAIHAKNWTLLKLNLIPENKTQLIFNRILAMSLNEHIVMIRVFKILWLNQQAINMNKTLSQRCNSTEDYIT